MKRNTKSKAKAIHTGDTGRPHVKLDKKMINRLASIGCPLNEIAAVLDVSPNTIRRNARKEWEAGKRSQRAKLRLKQWEAVEKGNVTMMIWLGKQILDQREPIRIQHTGVPTSDPESAPIQVENADPVTMIMNNPEAYASMLKAMTIAQITVQPKETLRKHIESTARRRREIQGGDIIEHDGKATHGATTNGATTNGHRAHRISDGDQ